MSKAAGNRAIIATRLLGAVVLGVVGTVLLAADVAKNPARASADVEGYRKVIAPFLQQHCIKCHGPDKPKGKLSLHNIDGDLVAGKDLAKWQVIAERLALREMPPASEPRPPAQATERVLGWITGELARAGKPAPEALRKLGLPGQGNRIDHEPLFQAGTEHFAASPGRLWRISPQIYTAFSSRLNKNLKLAQPFSGSSAEGFKDYASLFVIDESTISQLMRNARAIVDLQISAKGGVKEFVALTQSDQPPARAVIETALRKQFQLVLQRSPSDQELQKFVSLMEKNIQNAGAEVGVRATLATVFLLPEALYRLELGRGQPDAHGRVLLAPRELANAIAFALTDAGLDTALLKAADEGRLNTREDTLREVHRLLNDKTVAKRRIMRFFEEYFGFTAALDVFKDVPRGQWRPEILVNDTRLLIQSILDQDKDVLRELLTTNKSFVNCRIDPKTGPVPARIANQPQNAKDKAAGKAPPPRQMEIHDLYNLPADWKWSAQQPIELPAEQRAGILTQPSWLAAFATNNENHAIRRGKWVREHLLSGVVPDVPITVDAQLPQTPEKTLRHRMDITKQQYCWQCHQKMNPIGLTFEKYDFLGRARATETVLDLEATRKNVDKNGKSRGDIMHEVKLETAGVVEHSGDAKLDGEVEDAVALIKKLAGSERVRQVFVRHAFRYWMGRNETLADAPTLVAADRAYVESGGSMKALIASLLTSDSFIYRK